MIKQRGTWWMPQEETHLEDYISQHGEYQKRNREWALRDLANHRWCIDVGAHIGLWSRDFQRLFEFTTMIEPRELHRQCLIKNVPETATEIIAALAGREQGQAGLEEYPGNTGHTHWRAEGTLPMIRLDDLTVRGDLDLIKIDVEGFELRVIQGAENLIRRYWPRICLEQKPHPLADEFGGRYAARDLLKSWGYQTRQHHGDDWVMEMPR